MNQEPTFDAIVALLKRVDVSATPLWAVRIIHRLIAEMPKDESLLDAVGALSLMVYQLGVHAAELEREGPLP